ncbi:ArsR/SmtB family transcription factor [Rhabdothermincola salaria]|uniref:ArsR/SmtB family transcription factor n=1 Tax=Rhabdothermincola salaria TaxID=2903142 RepID=UPI001E416188|nr:metalloregulator ArsR/SmtB family transcription factor [Rhabdothermincola salaria]MCD9624520.1 metalloregulator ArsR/SmtB family transcription factor [Rhabdothermincola salaria]
MSEHPRREAKNELFDAFASVAKALSSGRRVEIVDLLAQGERSVEEVAREIDQSVANTSHHLRSLATSGLVRSRRDGQRIIYRLASDRVAELWAAMRDVAATHVADIEVLAEAYLGARDEVQEVTADELARRVRRGRAIVIDVRPTTEYQAGHIAGARSIPLDRLADVVDDLPDDRDVIAYCRGPYCVYADDAVRLLTARGISSRRLDVGYPEWVRDGRPIESSDERIA